MVITCSTSGVGSCETARAFNVAVVLSSTAWSDSVPSVCPARHSHSAISAVLSALPIWCHLMTYRDITFRFVYVQVHTPKQNSNDDCVLLRSIPSYHRSFLTAEIYVGHHHRRPHYHCGHHNHCCPHRPIFSSYLPSTSSFYILRLNSQSLPTQVPAYILLLMI
jgi:hypothetical protein